MDDIDDPYRAEYSIVTYSVHGTICESLLLTAAYLKKEAFWWRKKHSNLWVETLST